MTDLKVLRQRFGLTQAHLADMLGINQASVSRWESGVEEVPARRRIELLEIFSNRRGQLDPAVKMLIGGNRNVGIFDSSAKCLRANERIACLFGARPQDLVGHSLPALVDLAWHSKIYGDTTREQRLYTEFTYMMFGAGRNKDKKLPIWTKHIEIGFDGVPAMTLYFSEVMPQVPETRLIKRITLDAIEAPAAA